MTTPVPPVIASDDIPDPPEAPQPAPTIELFMRVRENDAANEYEGGRILLQCINEGKPADMLDANLVVVARTDAFLMQLPWKTRAAKQLRFFKVTIAEVPIADVPVDPELLSEIGALEERVKRLKQAAAAPTAADRGSR